MSLLPSQADPLIRDHAIHWVLCNEAYQTKRREEIDGWELLEEEYDLCTYTRDDFCIVAFRGTYDLKDVGIDYLISRPGLPNPKVHYSKDLIVQLIDKGYMIQVTGHSLGGDTARQIGRMFGLGVVTFNCAAPPTNPASSGSNEVHYHIVFDLISAWQEGAIRIDKGYRPKDTPLGTRAAPLMLGGALANSLFEAQALKPLAEAHSILNFSMGKFGVLMNTEKENILWQKWFQKIPISMKIIFYKYNGGKLPNLE